LVRWVRLFLCLVLVGSCFVGASGCGGSGGKGEIKGKVTLDGQPVRGIVVFVVGDKEVSAGTLPPDGVYAAFNVPKGAAKIKVLKDPAAMPMGGPAPPPGGKAPETAGSTSAAMVPPPDKYTSLDNGLTLNVTGGRQTHDIALTK